MEVEIRKAVLEDLEVLSEMVAEFFGHHADLLGGRRPSAECGRREAEQMLTDPKSSVLVLVVDGRISGFARVQEHEGAAFLREIYVTPGLRGRGWAVT